MFKKAVSTSFFNPWAISFSSAMCEMKTTVLFMAPLSECIDSRSFRGELQKRRQVRFLLLAAQRFHAGRRDISVEQ
jgi:hypothetical protein